MKTKLSACFITAIAACVLSSCASPARPLSLAPVGPAPSGVSLPSAEGTLLVYSAYKTGVPSPSLPENLRQHTDYELRSTDHQPLRLVANAAGYQGEDPLPLHLAPGRYEVMARANGHGLVTVPVVIAADRTTVLHLEGGDPQSDQLGLNLTNSVQLPGGEMVGWQAELRTAPHGRP